MSAVKSSSAYEPPASAFNDPHLRARMLRDAKPIQPTIPPFTEADQLLKLDRVELLVLVARLAWDVAELHELFGKCVEISHGHNCRIRVLEELAGPRRVAKEHRRMQRAETEVQS